MIVKVRKIGNSTGILLSRSIIEQCHIKDEVSIEIKDNSIIIQPVKKNPREGWAQQFQTANSLADKDNFMGDLTNSFDQEEWTWE